MSKGVHSNAFKEQSTIISVNFGKECEFVENEAFKKCISLEKINEDNEIKHIGSNAFAETKLSDINFSKLSRMYSGAFSLCYNLKNINIPNCIDVPTEAFFRCISLEKIELPNATSICSNAFAFCSNLSYINIPNCSIIESNAFLNCSNLQNVNNGSVVRTKIYNNAFMSCSNLKNIYFNNIIEIGERSFEGCTNLYKVNLNQCTKIGSSAFIGCTNITQVSLSSCSQIYPYAFLSCSKLNKVYINNPSSIFCNLMSSNVFCMNMSSSFVINPNIVFYFKPDTINRYKSDSYWKYYINNMVIMPNNNQIIYNSIDGDLIEVSDNIKDYINLHKKFDKYILLEFKNKIENLKNNIFIDSTRLTSIDIPSECKFIETKAFEGYKNLENITLSNTLEYIDEYAFKNCESLKSFDIPESVESLGEGIFAGCKNMENFSGKFVTYNGKAIVSNEKLICVIPKDDTFTEGRIHNISDIDVNIRRLGKSCFYGCENMRRVNIPSNIEVIGDNAFEGCKNLCEVHFEGIIPPKIENDIFKDVREDFKIFVPEESFEEYYTAFSNTGYEYNILPKPNDDCLIYYSDDKINSYHEEVNINSINVKYYRISNIDTTLSSNIFKEHDITSVILGEGITKINKEAFKNCKELKYIYLSDNINELNDQCFYGCESLTRIHIPGGHLQQRTTHTDSSSPDARNTNSQSQSIENSIFFGNEIFYGCKNLKEFITYYKGNVSDDGRCYIENSTLKFFAQGNLTDEEKTYAIPDNVNIIDNSAFRGSTLKSIKLNSSISEIRNSAFRDCSDLQNIENWNGVRIISQYAFMGCINLGKISLPNELTTIGNYAFNGCENMYINTNIPNSVTSIGNYAFNLCSNFKCVNIKNEQITLNLKNITQINQYTFNGCCELTNVNINDKIKTISDYAFAECSKLKSITITNTSQLNTINKFAFKGCENLIDLYLPTSLTYIGQSAFEGCSKYKGNDNFYNNNNNNDDEIIGYGIIEPTLQKTLSIPNNVSSIGIACFKNTGIEFLKISENSKLNKIPTEAFKGCVNLKSIDISSQNITSIDDYAFDGCSNLCNNNTSNVGKLILPNSINNIGDYAFNECINITNITLPFNLSRLGDHCFSIGSSNVKIYVSTRMSPPLFTKDGNQSLVSQPFGTSNIPNIMVPRSVYNNYKTNVYWIKYANHMRQII